MKNYKKNTAKLKVVPSRGWNLQGIFLLTGGSEKWIENGKSFSIPRNKDAMAMISLCNSKDEMIDYIVNFKR